MDVSVIREIGQTWPTPVYIYESKTLKDNYRQLDQAYKSYYPNFQIAYSFKTNYTPAICADIRSLGGVAEVVSGMEYKLAKKIGFLPKQIIVNGPGKWNELPNMLKEGALVMLDNEAELERALECAQQLDHPVRVGFRLNFPIDGGKNSRFGFDVENKSLPVAIEKARQTKNIRIEGIHFHLSGARSLAAWAYRAEKMVAYANTLLRESERKIIDLGSGMFGRMEACLAVQFGQTIPTFAEYAEKVAGIFAVAYGHLPQEQQPILVVEPGTTLVANTLSYLTKVLAVKTVRERRIAIVDGSAHQVGELCKKKQLPISVLSGSNETKLSAPVEITGYTCLEDDILHPACSKPVGPEDLIHIRNVGSYSNVLAPPFIQEGCAMIALAEDGSIRLVKRAEHMEEMLSTYMIEK